MADILIRGMEMPKNCLYCPCVRIINEQSVFCYAPPSCTDDYNGGEVASGLTTDDLLDRTGTVKTPSWCPLVPLPEGHGDLVERKALNLFPDYKDVRNRIKQTIKATERDGRNITGVTIDLLKQTLVALDSLRSVRRYFLNAKTIVPAEGGKADGN